MSIAPERANDVWQTLNEARKDIVTVDVRTTAHEAVCAERYKNINFKLNLCLAAVGLVLMAQALGLDVAIKSILKVKGLVP